MLCDIRSLHMRFSVYIWFLSHLFTIVLMLYMCIQFYFKACLFFSTYITSCCESRQQSLPTCSNPLQQQPLSTVNVANFCPSPPPISLTDLNSPSGALDDKNVFVAEYFLNLSVSLQQVVFFQRYQAGFVLHSLSPPYLTCGCGTIATSCLSLHLASAGGFAENTGSGDSMLMPSTSPPLQLASLGASCGQLINSTSQTFNPITSCTTPTNYTFNGLLQNCMNFASCNGTDCRCGDCAVGTNYQPQLPKQHVTVWYNNEVCAIRAYTSMCVYVCEWSRVYVCAYVCVACVCLFVCG